MKFRFFDCAAATGLRRGMMKALPAVMSGLTSGEASCGGMARVAYRHGHAGRREVG